MDPETDLTLTWGSVSKSNLRNVTGIRVKEEDRTVTGGSPAVSDKNSDGVVDFYDLLEEIHEKDGWYLNFSEVGERNLGQATVLGEIVSFTTYVPDNDVCSSGGESYLYGVYYKTGTAYWKGVLKTPENNFTGVNSATGEVIEKISIGKGYSTTLNLHVGRKKGSKAFVQTSTGAIIGVEQVNPGITKSGKVSWEED